MAKINSKWIKDLNVRPEAIKLLEENIGKTLSDIHHSRMLYDPPPRIQEIKAKINKWDPIKLKSFCRGAREKPTWKSFANSGNRLGVPLWGASQWSSDPCSPAPPHSELHPDSGLTLSLVLGPRQLSCSLPISIG